MNRRFLLGAGLAAAAVAPAIIRTPGLLMPIRRLRPIDRFDVIQGQLGSQIFFNDIPLIAADGTYNFQTVTWGEKGTVMTALGRRLGNMHPLTGVYSHRPAPAGRAA